MFSLFFNQVNVSLNDHKIPLYRYLLETNIRKLNIANCQKEFRSRGILVYC